MNENFYKKDNYLDKTVEYIISSDIIEYDMKDAGLSIIKKYKMLDEDTIQYLETLPKKMRAVKIGLIMRDNKELTKQHRLLLREQRKLFIEANELEEKDILSIKSDAIFVKRRCLNTEFDEVIFREKNIYTSYYYLNRKEFYVGQHGLDIKGISDDILDVYHREYFCKELWNIFKAIETAPKEIIIKRIVRFADAYKNLEFPIEYYRELDSKSRYRIKREFTNNRDYTLFATEFGDKEMVDISFNYVKYIAPLVNLFL